MGAKQYFKCRNCELNFVEEEDGLCSVCKSQLKRNERNDGIFNPMRKYKNVCFQCRENLDSQFDKFCPKCGWLICHNCGSCGCT
ncbi:MAG: hypothetical protein K2G38_02735 [Clostridia bacterium]|nr:hypothetical protein [Clostridia bacterium]